MSGRIRWLVSAMIAATWVVSVCPETARAEGTPEISGVHELVIGVRPGEVDDTVAFLGAYGYRVAEDGVLAASDAAALYGVESAVRGIRLRHQDADHGLYRLQVWSSPRNDGLGLAPMKVLGGRWGAAVTRDVYAIVNHVEDAVALDAPLVYVPPQRQVIYAAEGASKPFVDAVACVREMLLIRPRTRQILFQRYGYDLPLYGRIHDEANLSTSQVTHAGLVVQGEADMLRFYDEVLGLKRARDGHVSDDSDPASQAIFALEAGERYMSTDFDDPRSDPTDLSKVRSGRLKIIRFLPGSPPLPDLRDRSKPGSLGLSFYTYRVHDLDAYRVRVLEGGATEVSAIRPNELGERSFTFAAPDGTVFALIEGR